MRGALGPAHRCAGGVGGRLFNVFSVGDMFRNRLSAVEN